MRTILLLALAMINYRLYAPDFDDGSCLVVLPWVAWSVIPLLLLSLLWDMRAVVLRYRRLGEWKLERQRYLRMRNWVRAHSDAKGVV